MEDVGAEALEAAVEDVGVVHHVVVVLEEDEVECQLMLPQLELEPTKRNLLGMTNRLAHLLLSTYFLKALIVKCIIVYIQVCRSKNTIPIQ